MAKRRNTDDEVAAIVVMMDRDRAHGHRWQIAYVVREPTPSVLGSVMWACLCGDFREAEETVVSRNIREKESR